MNGRYEKASKQRLSNELQSKFDTTIIGSLAVFEEEFGHLWGHGLRYKELTDQQKEFREIWKTARVRILDAGNANLRAMQGLLSRYSVEWNRYVMNFRLPKENDNEKY